MTAELFGAENVIVQDGLGIWVRSISSWWTTTITACVLPADMASLGIPAQIPASGVCKSVDNPRMKQSSLGLSNTTKRTRKREFLDAMELVVPRGRISFADRALRP